MKKILFCLMLIASLIPLAFAQSSACEQNCCSSNGGTWDSDLESCGSPSGEYYNCINKCSGTAGFNYNCCGAGFIGMFVLGGAVFVNSRRRA